MSTTNIKIDSNLENVNDLLFQQIKQLSTASVDSKNIKQEIDKSKAMANMAAQIVNSTKLQFDVVKKFGFNNQPTAITDQSE